MDHSLIVPGWLILALLTAWIGSTKNRSAVGWFIGSMFFPLLALIFVILVDPLPRRPR
jgi:hypothetical protein